MLKKSIGAATLACAAIALTAPSAAAGPHHGGYDPCERRTNGSIDKLLDCVDADGAMEHLEAFQEIADANGGSRASGTSGYDASAEYVAAVMRKAGYRVSIEPFSFELFEELSEPVLEQIAPVPTTYATDAEPGFSTMEYSGSGDVTAAVEAVDVVVPPGAEANTSTSGCEPEDFADFTAGSIALLQRGTCAFGDKAANAEAAGAVGAVIFNEGQEGRAENLLGTLGGPGVTIPVVGASYEIGAELAQAEGAQVRLAVDAQVETRETSNVIAESRWGDDDNVVMAGAHLDSVAEGSGINDNGSGSAAILEVAQAMAKVRGENKLRFAWWGAEESGLIGSYEYTEALSDEEIEDIALYLNFDMVASPNHIFGIYDGDGSDFGLAGPEGSDAIEATFEEFFERAGEPSQGTEFSGRSDYAGFIDVGIPAGGLFTGAEGIKTEEEAALYGGTAGEAYDPCYHSACDDLSNLNLEAFDTNIDAIAYSLLTYARSTEDVNGVVPDRGHGKGHGKHWGDKGHGKGDQRPGRSGWDD
ncbi:M28 family metallopeptidase [Demequina activiva]|uniref:Aminopeptidase n=1 Tax=Demequina activiva TaxID=1582364 RepID=A0A919Q7F3_9MICO|nr:M28 family metallopeptidase [Demequina activiva]GIG55563.1 aminopeptidase [Demequina activiva]